MKFWVFKCCLNLLLSYHLTSLMTGFIGWNRVRKTRFWFWPCLKNRSDFLVLLVFSVLVVKLLNLNGVELIVLIGHLTLLFCQVKAKSILWIVIQTLSCCFFNLSSTSIILATWLLGIDFFSDFSEFYCFAVKICVRGVISAFRSIAWLTSKKMTSELTYGTLNFMNIY